MVSPFTGNAASASTEFALDTEIRFLDVGGGATAGTYTITLTTSITESFELSAINLASGVTLIINGGGFNLNGASTYRGLFAYSGNLTVSNLTIQNAKAAGGAGGYGFWGGGGGGAGLGGGLFVAQHATVTLNNVGFSGNSAYGGAGGRTDTGQSKTTGVPYGIGIRKAYGYGGGGGMGGAGGNANTPNVAGGGGGVGVAASGGGTTGSITSGVTNSAGGAGILAGASGTGGAGAGYHFSGGPTAKNTAGGATGGGGGYGGTGTSTSNGKGVAGGGGGYGGTAGATSGGTPEGLAPVAGGPKGGFGGFGGGGGGSADQGGNGGFGGGGGDGGYFGGSGGFGGGGGGNGGVGGFGGGNGGGTGTASYKTFAAGAGGGGLGAGGDIFVQSGGTLLINTGTATTGTIAAGAVAGGAAGKVATSSQIGPDTADVKFTSGTIGGGTVQAGSAFGSGFFINNTSTTITQFITLAPAKGDTLTISGAIADQKGSGGTGANATQGGLIINAGGTLALNAADTFTGGIQLSNDSTLTLGAVGAAGTGTITVSSAKDVVAFTEANKPTVTIAGLSTTHGAIELIGGTVTSASVASNVLTINKSGGGSVTLNVSGLANGTLNTLNFGGNAFISDEAIVPCFLATTPIRTDRGDIAVEDLVIGDRVITLSGTAEPIKWIGRRSYASAFAAGNEDVIPIEIQANALADNVPAQDLVVSALHAMFLDGVLVPAKSLVNGVTIRARPDIDPIRYFHIELAQHAIIFAAGAPTETYIDCNNRGMFHNAAEYTQLYPDTIAGNWTYCAPRVEGGPALEPIRATLAARAGIEGTDPALPCGTLHGQVDDANLSIINGWAYDPVRPGIPVRLEIMLDDGVIAEVTADRYLPFLQQQGYGDGKHGFAVWLPAGLSPLARHVIRVRRKDDGAELSGSPHILEPVSQQSLLRGEALLPAVEAVARGATDRATLDGLLRALLTSADRVRQISALQQDKPKDAGAGLLTWRGKTKPRRVLVIDDRLPRRQRDAGSHAVLSHITALAALGWAVEFIASREVACDETTARGLEAQGIRVHRSPEIATVEELLRRRQDAFQAVYLHRLSNAEAYSGLARAYQRGARLLYSVADLHHVRVARQARAQSSLELAGEARWLKQRELAAMRMADAVISHSPWEVEYLAKEAAGVAVHVVPWAVPVRARETTAPARHGVAFIGGYRHAPNVDAARWLAETIMPLVWRARPDVVCYLVGGDWPESVSWLADARVRRLGAVADLHDVFELVRTTVAPLRFGAGIKGKVLDSFAAGVPCVMTPVAAEGLALPSVLDGWVGDSAGAIASLIVRAHGDGGFVRAAEWAASGFIVAGFTEHAVERAMAGVVGGAAADAGAVVAAGD